jgi:hypothetical protein
MHFTAVSSVSLKSQSRRVLRVVRLVLLRAHYINITTNSLKCVVTSSYQHIIMALSGNSAFAFENLIHHYIKNKVASRCLSLCMLRSLNYPRDFDAVFLIERVIQEKGKYKVHRLSS